MFEPGEGRDTRQVLRGIERYPLHAELKQGIVPETIGIIAVRIAGGELIDPLREQVTQRMISIRRMSLVVHSGGQGSVKPIWRSIPRSKRAPKSDDNAPPSKSARTVYPDMGGKRSCSGVEYGISKPLGVFME